MQQIIQQVGELLLGSIPTLILFILLVFSYQFLVQGPLSKTLKERRARTVGAIEDAQRAIAAAESKTEEYASKLRQARAEVFRIREERLHEWAQERDKQLASARDAAAVRVSEAKAAIQTEVAVAQKTLLGSAGQLAEQVIRAVMPATAGGIR